MKQAPAWNQVIRSFAGNSDVSFGDINLSSDQIRGNHNPGAGGWPTIKYFNKKTGYDGAAYVQKTSTAICDELGKVENMEAYVMDAGETSLCNIDTKKGCTEKEMKYSDEWSLKTTGEVDSQLERLVKTNTDKMKAPLAQWFRQRVGVLKQIAKRSTQASSQEL